MNDYACIISCWNCLHLALIATNEVIIHINSFLVLLLWTSSSDASAPRTQRIENVCYAWLYLQPLAAGKIGPTEVIIQTDSFLVLLLLTASSIQPSVTVFWLYHFRITQYSYETVFSYCCTYTPKKLRESPCHRLYRSTLLAVVTVFWLYFRIITKRRIWENVFRYCCGSKPIYSFVEVIVIVSIDHVSYWLSVWPLLHAPTKPYLPVMWVPPVYVDESTTAYSGRNFFQ